MKKMKSQRQAGFLMAKIRQVGGRLFERMLGFEEIGNMRDLTALCEAPGAASAAAE